MHFFIKKCYCCNLAFQVKVNYQKFFKICKNFKTSRGLISGNFKNLFETNYFSKAVKNNLIIDNLTLIANYQVSLIFCYQQTKPAPSQAVSLPCRLRARAFTCCSLRAPGLWD